MKIYITLTFKEIKEKSDSIINRMSKMAGKNKIDTFDTFSDFFLKAVKEEFCKCFESVDVFNITVLYMDLYFDIKNRELLEEFYKYFKKTYPLVVLSELDEVCCCYNCGRKDCLEKNKIYCYERKGYVKPNNHCEKYCFNKKEKK